MINEDELMRLASVFDNEKTKVIGVLPKNIKLKEVVGMSKWDAKTSRVTITRNGVLYLCWVNTSECMSTMLDLKEEIAKIDDPEDRWAAWEIHGSQEPHALIERLIKSRLRNAEERNRYYGPVMTNDLSGYEPKDIA